MRDEKGILEIKEIWRYQYQQLFVFLCSLNNSPTLAGRQKIINLLITLFSDIRKKETIWVQTVSYRRLQQKSCQCEKNSHRATGSLKNES